MEKNLTVNLNGKDEQVVEDVAFMVVSEDKVGVTDSLDDVISLLAKDGNEPAEFYLVRGEKHALLEAEYKLLFHDAVDQMRLSNLNAGQKFITPEFYTDFNLCAREVSEKGNGLRSIIRRL